MSLGILFWVIGAVVVVAVLVLAAKKEEPDTQSESLLLDAITGKPLGADTAMVTLVTQFGAQDFKVNQPVSVEEGMLLSIAGDGGLDSGKSYAAVSPEGATNEQIMDTLFGGGMAIEPKDVSIRVEQK